MLQILYNIITQNKEKEINSDTVAFKLVHRGLASVLLCCLMHSLYLTYHGNLIKCGGNSMAPLSTDFVDQMCWTNGVHIYANKTTRTSPYWNWTYTPVKQGFYPGISGMADPKETVAHLTLITKIPLFFILSLVSTLAGKCFWNWLQGNFLKDLIGDLDSRSEIPRGTNEEQRDFQLDEMSQTFKLQMRFHSEVLGYYIGCLVCNISNLALQNVTIMTIIGNMDMLFALKIFYFSFIDYQQWPVVHANVCVCLPCVSVCHITICSVGGNHVTYDFICALQWSQTYLLIFAGVFVINMCCILVLLGSITYYIVFALSCFVREGELGNTLKLDETSSAYKGLKYITPGSAFLLVLLSKNVKYHYVCSILESVYHEFKRNQNVAKKYVNGITVT